MKNTKSIINIQKRHYEGTLRTVNFKNAEVYFKKRINLIKEYVDFSTINNILDIGCGEGLSIKYLKQIYPKKNYYGIDLSLSQLAGAKKYSSNICVSKTESLPFLDKKFDLVIFNSVLHHVSNLYLSLAETVRVTVNKGKLIIIEPNRFNPLIVLLSLFKKHERGQLKLDYKKITNELKNKIDNIDISYMNCLCYPYQRFPSSKLLPLIKKIEKSFLFPTKIKSHFYIFAKLK